MTDQIAANIPTLRNVAAQLASAASDFEALLPEFKELEAAARKEASANTVDGSAAPIYAPLLASLATVGSRVATQIGQLHHNVAGDAAALSKFADDLEHTDQSHGQKINGITITSAAGPAAGPHLPAAPQHTPAPARSPFGPIGDIVKGEFGVD
ncbi:MAG: hypothetical protein PHQ28_00065 [Mycobacterium sp.]|nr:hypothetical protein [Mycobacterium sp.]